MAWLMIVVAGALEMVWSYSAKQANGWTNWGWSAVTVVSSLISFFLLTFALKSLPPWHRLCCLDRHWCSGQLRHRDLPFGRIGWDMAHHKRHGHCGRCHWPATERWIQVTARARCEIAGRAKRIFGAPG